MVCAWWLLLAWHMLSASRAQVLKDHRAIQNILVPRDVPVGEVFFLCVFQWSGQRNYIFNLTSKMEELASEQEPMIVNENNEKTLNFKIKFIKEVEIGLQIQFLITANLDDEEVNRYEGNVMRTMHNTRREHIFGNSSDEILFIEHFYNQHELIDIKYVAHNPNIGKATMTLSPNDAVYVEKASGHATTSFYFFAKIDAPILYGHLNAEVINFATTAKIDSRNCISWRLNVRNTTFDLQNYTISLSPSDDGTTIYYDKDELAAEVPVGYLTAKPLQVPWSNQDVIYELTDEFFTINQEGAIKVKSDKAKGISSFDLKVALSLSHQPHMKKSIKIVQLRAKGTNNAPETVPPVSGIDETKFTAYRYEARVAENSPRRSPLRFEGPKLALLRYKPVLYVLSLSAHQDVFEVQPEALEFDYSIKLLVRDPTKLDYETNKEFVFFVIARIANDDQAAAMAQVRVSVEDVNDNPPRFFQSRYEMTVPENYVNTSSILTVQARDVESGPIGDVRYTAIIGPGAEVLRIDRESGEIFVVGIAFDREAAAQHIFLVEARDEGGGGLRGEAALVIHVTDVNDLPPVFSQRKYNFLLTSDGRSFRFPALVEATDGDATAPNNLVRFSINPGDDSDFFKIFPDTGELSLFLADKIPSVDEMLSLTVTATDGGSPPRSASVPVRVSRCAAMAAGRQEHKWQKETYMLPDRGQSEEEIMTYIEKMTGRNVRVQEMWKGNGQINVIARTQWTGNEIAIEDMHEEFLKWYPE